MREVCIESTWYKVCTHAWGGFVSIWVNWEITIDITIHDEMSNLRKKGAGGGPLRHN